MRNSKVKSIFVNSNEFSSVIQIGDSVEVNPYTNGLAVQRYQAVFYKYDPLKQEPLPLYLKPKRVITRRINEQPIRVNHININGITGSSVLHVGSFKRGEAISQIKHIRILQGSR